MTGQAPAGRRRSPPGGETAEAAWLVKYRYFQAPYVVAFTLSPADPLTYTASLAYHLPAE